MVGLVGYESLRLCFCLELLIFHPLNVFSELDGWYPTRKGDSNFVIKVRRSLFLVDVIRVNKSRLELKSLLVSSSS